MAKKKRGSTASNAVILIFTTALAKGLGFGREMSLAYVYGASPVSDAYFVAFSIPTIIFAGIGSAMLTSYISSYSRIQQQNPRRLRRFTDTVITMVILISLAIMCLFWLLKRPIVKLFALGFEGETLELAISFSQVIIISLLFIGVYFILQGYLQIHGSYFAVGMVSAPLNLCVIASMFLSVQHGQEVLGWGVVAGYFASFLMLYLAAKGNRFSYRPNFNFRTPEIRRLLLVVVPIFLGKAITELNTMIDRTIASILPAGSISALSYGNRVIGFVTSHSGISDRQMRQYMMNTGELARDIGTVLAGDVRHFGHHRRLPPNVPPFRHEEPPEAQAYLCPQHRAYVPDGAAYLRRCDSLCGRDCRDALPAGGLHRLRYPAHRRGGDLLRHRPHLLQHQGGGAEPLLRHRGYHYPHHKFRSGDSY